MRLRFSVLSMAVGLAMCSPVFAEAPSPFELARGLRDADMPDLAMEYLNSIAPKLSMADQKILPMEYARTRLALATSEPEEGKRVELVSQAKIEFEAFLKANPNHPLVPTANVELARVILMQGQDQLSRARSRRTEEERLAEIAKARPFFQNAAKKYADAAGALDKQVLALGEPTDPATRQQAAELTGLRRRALLEQGISLYNLGLTHVSQAEVRERGNQITAAKKVFDALAAESEEDPRSWEAKAWAAQCLYENDDRSDASTAFAGIMASRDPAAIAGKRQARFFDIQNTLFDGENPKRFNLVANAAQDWLLTFPQHSNTREGLALRYYLAVALKEQAEAVIGQFRDPETGKLTRPGTAEAQAYLRRAEQIFKTLTDTDNEYTDRATRARLQVIVDLSAGRSDDPEQLNFEESYLAAMVRQAEFSQRVQAAIDGEGAPLDEETIDQESKEVYTKVVEYLEHGIPLATEQDSARDLLEAQMMLVFGYLTTEQYFRAAVLGEHIARTNSTNDKAVIAAANAMQAYNLAAAEEAELPEPEKRRITELAQFMDQTWPNEPATDAARHQLAYFQIQNDDFIGACATLSKIKPTYAGLYQARLMQGGAAYLLSRGERPEAQIKPTIDTAVGDLGALPPVAEDAGPEKVLPFAQARIQYGQLLLIGGRDYPKAQTVGNEVAAMVAKLAEDENAPKTAVADVRFSARALELSAILGQALAASQAKDYAKLAEILDPVFEQIKTEVDAKLSDEELAAPGLERLRQVRQNLLILALRSRVQDNQIEKARDVLEVLEKAGSSIESSLAILQQVVQEIRGQIRLQRANGDEEGATRTEEAFLSLLDAIAARPNKSDGLLMFLARGYGSVGRLENHKTAANLLEQIPKPAVPDDPDAARLDPQVRNYRTVQFLLVRELRQAGEFDKAQRLLDEIMGTRDNRGWAFSSVEVRKESYLLLEDRAEAAADAAERHGLWTEAINNWMAYARVWQGQVKVVPKSPGEYTNTETLAVQVVLGSAMAPMADVVRAKVEAMRRQQTAVKEAYFDIYIETYRAVARANGRLSDTRKSEEYTKIANRFIELQTRNPDMSLETKEKMADVLLDFPLLKQKYEDLNGPELKPAGATVQVQ